ncbi:hypothetical protein vseg_010515 [Gypsophila vaccaria]
MSFFDTTPSGRILSQAAGHHTSFDVFVPFVLNLTVAMYISPLRIIIITCQYAWQTIFLLIPLGPKLQVVDNGANWTTGVSGRDSFSD